MIDMNVYSVGSFERAEEMRQFVRDCDAALERQIEEAISYIESVPDLRLLGLTGPTCSGKTTAAGKITRHLSALGLHLHVISLDDFYYDKEYLHRRAANADLEIDYDSEKTIDIALLKEQAERLFEGKETVLPRFDFHTGNREIGERIVPTPRDVFLFEGIQVLYSNVNETLNRDGTFPVIYIAPQSSISVGGEVFEANELRLYRRLVRDFRHRSTSPEFTLFLWQSVRENEEKNIFPNVFRCSASIDSTMPCEVGLLKPYLEQILQTIPVDNAYFERAQGILKKISAVQPVRAEYMTEKSLYKEFI